MKHSGICRRIILALIALFALSGCSTYGAWVGVGDVPPPHGASYNRPPKKQKPPKLPKPPKHKHKKHHDD